MRKHRGGKPHKGSAKVWLGNLAIRGAGAAELTAELTAAAPKARARPKAPTARKARIVLSNARRQRIENQAGYLTGAWEIETHDPQRVGKKAMGISSRAVPTTVYPGGRSA